MPRLIDADALLMDNSWEFYDENGNRNGACIAVENAPTVDAESVKHGHWTNISVSVTGNSSAECSLCGTVVHDAFADVSRINYCPNCGTKMDEVEDGTTD